MTELVCPMALHPLGYWWRIRSSHVPFNEFKLKIPRDAQRVAHSADVPSQTRSVLVPFSGQGSEIPLPSDPSRALKNALKPLRLRGATHCASRGFFGIDFLVA